MRLLAFLLLLVPCVLGKFLKSSDELDLSDFGITRIDIKRFEDLGEYKSLNLSNNDLEHLSKNVFANLSKLKDLDLSNNAIEAGHFYQGLDSLESLNISNNKVTFFEQGHFFGLPKSCNILTDGINFSAITASMFERPNDIQEEEKEAEALSESASEIAIPDLFESAFESPPSRRESMAKVCINEGHLMSLETLKSNKDLAKGCREVSFDFGALKLDGLGIKTFEEGWYRCRDRTINSLNLQNNEISELTNELLNDLPDDIIEISLRGNRIERLTEEAELLGSIEILDLSENGINEFEPWALVDLYALESLDLSGNNLNNTIFLDTLPISVRSVTLNRNNIGELSFGLFPQFQYFTYLDLSYNNITKIESDRLRSFSSLRILDLSFNGISDLEPARSWGSGNLVVLKLNDNQISEIPVGLFSDFGSMRKIVDKPISPFNTLKSLDLSGNFIETIKAATFLKVPTNVLNLKRNNISKIETGSFHLPNLKRLDLSHNSLKTINGDCFKGLDHLDHLSLASNGITTVKKGATWNLRNLTVLDLSHNAIQRLENGALFGLSKQLGTQVQLQSVPVKIIQGGLFDDL